MASVLLMLLTFVGYVVAYRTYGRFLAKRIFKLDDRAPVPSKELADGRDFVATRKGIIFGHHYTSIAGTGPIVGPAIGIIWGWVPALVWVLLGSIVMGAVHDFGSLVVSLRNRGKSIADITAKYVNPRVRFVFFLIVFFELLIVIAVFGLVIAVIFAMYPASVFPVWCEIPIALALGWILYKRNGNVKLFTVLAVLAMYATVVAGHWLPLSMPAVAGVPATGVWTVVLLVYAFIASTLPVTTLLQPRDYINAWQLFVAMALLVLGVLASGFGGTLHIAAPAVNTAPAGAPPLFPFLFITIACGAISGFHSLVSSGTSSKQVAREDDALFVGYGSMLMEAALATVVIIAVAAGIGMAYETGDGSVVTGSAAWNTHYASWTASAGLGSKLTAVVVGSANMIASLGIPKQLGLVVMGVFIASFAGTTLDTATRIQRYVVTELAEAVNAKPLTNRYGATLFAVVTAAALAFASGAGGKGALALWPMFGAVNQLLAALALLLITLYLRRNTTKAWLVAGIPCALMLVITVWAAVMNQVNFTRQGSPLLIVINGLILVLAVWMVAESVLVFVRRPEPAA